jgi:hypothetical protein
MIRALATNHICLRNFVWCAAECLPGEKNGRAFGTKLNTAVKPVGGKLKIPRFKLMSSISFFKRAHPENEIQFRRFQKDLNYETYLWIFNTNRCRSFIRFSGVGSSCDDRRAGRSC